MVNVWILVQGTDTNYIRNELEGFLKQNSFWKILLDLDAYEYLERQEDKIRKCLLWSP